MKNARTKEPQYQIQVDTAREKGPVAMGLTSSHLWRTDPRHLGFLLARYKFCAKMLAGCRRVVEIGCGDGFGASVVLQTVGKLHGVDFDPVFIANAREINRERRNISFSVHDIAKRSLPGKYEAAYSLDVIEHIAEENEDAYLRHCIAGLPKDGIFIVGTPNIRSSRYASVWSNEGHINLKDDKALKTLLLAYFHTVFLFSMNDEVVHTGYYPMAHYFLAVAVGVRKPPQQCRV